MGIDEDFVLSPGKRAWVAGGSLLLASVVVGVATQPSWSLSRLLGTLLASAALVVFAVGFRGQGSVTGRHLAGTIALCAFAGWTLFGALFAQVYSIAVATGAPAIGYVNDIISVTLALIAVVVIGRGDALPRPWNWAPAVALASWVALWLIEQMLRDAVVTSSTLASALMTLDGLVHLGAPVFLGATAIALANRAAASSDHLDRPVESRTVLALVDSIIESTTSADVLIARVDAERRPTRADAREGMRLRFALATADRALADLHWPAQHEAARDEIRRTIDFYQHMIKHGMESGFSAILAEPAHLQSAAFVPGHRVERLIELRSEIEDSLTGANA